MFPGVVLGGYFELAEEELEVALEAALEAELAEAELAEGLRVRSLLAKLECLCADGSWDPPFRLA